MGCRPRSTSRRRTGREHSSISLLARALSSLIRTDKLRNCPRERAASASTHASSTQLSSQNRRYRLFFEQEYSSRLRRHQEGRNNMANWLSEREQRLVTGAETASAATPIPTQIVSNGEYLPPPQSETQKRLERRIYELADIHGKRLGLDRRQFLRTSCGMAAAFLAMKEIFGVNVFQVDEAEAREPELMLARAQSLAGQFIFDDQTHFIRDDFEHKELLGLGDFAAEHWNPKLKEEGVTLTRYKFQNYVKEIFYDSDTNIALLSGAPFDDPTWWLLSNEAIVKARDMVNEFAGSRRMLAHTVITPKQPGWVDEVDKAIAVYKPDSWKSYTIGDPLSPGKYPWRLDDEKVMYPFYEKAVKAGITTICIHK